MALTINTDKPTLKSFPKNYLIQVDGLSAITLSGDDKNSYLQGQITCDVNLLPEKQLIVGAHCDAKGKMLSLFRLFKHEDSNWLLQPKTTINASLEALKKFGVFAKVTISVTVNYDFYALVGEQSQQLLKQHFSQIPDSMSPVIQLGSTTLLYIANSGNNANLEHNNRYLIIDKSRQLTSLLQKFSLPIYSQAVWNLHEIVNGFPLMGEQSVSKYAPQMLNVQAINGISFTKGCYLGQETVARMQYLGRNKRALFTLTGQIDAKLSTADSVIEQQLGENWRKTGTILHTYHADDHRIYIQAVLASDIDETTKLRLKISNECFTTLKIQPLPYSLVTDQTINSQ